MKILPGKAEGGGPQLLDLLLSGASSCVAVYAAGVSLASDPNAFFFALLVLVGTLVSVLMVLVVRRRTVLGLDTLGYLGAAVVALFAIEALNAVNPEPIFTGPLQTAGILCWMLALGSAFVWRDQTMLFQAVPAVALFGLVGCYDTFRASVIYFFAFLVFQATLMSRAHGRAMLRQAQLSGRDTGEMVEMRRGPWRWMAGPEWALASALTIVLISVVGAPLLRQSARGFSGLVRYTPPLPQSSQAGPTGAAMSTTRVGLGPRSLSDAPVLRVTLPEPLYLRSFIYGDYVNGAWNSRAPEDRLGDDRIARAAALERSKNRKEINFVIEPLALAGGAVPVPGEVIRTFGNRGSYSFNIGGSMSLHADAPYPPLQGLSKVYDGGERLTSTDTRIAELEPEYLQTNNTPREVAALAKQVTKNARTDYEAALAIKSAIESRARYNLDAGATPTGKDPVSYFLFESQEGYCDLFASSMTLMARSVGLPARYVVGYYPFEDTKDDHGRFIVRQKDAHAWCEIFFDSAGWVVFDATEGADFADGSGPGSSHSKSFWTSPWFTIPLGIIVFGTSALFLFVRAKSYRLFRRSPAFAQLLAKRQQLKLRGRIGKEYTRFEAELRSVIKRPRGFAETIGEYTASAREKLGPVGSLADDVSTTFAAVLYSAPNVDPKSPDQLRQQVNEFRAKRRRAGK